MWGDAPQIRRRIGRRLSGVGVSARSRGRRARRRLAPVSVHRAMPTPVLAVAVDLSAGSEAALVRAATFAARAGARLLVIHAVATSGGSTAPLAKDPLAAFTARALGREALAEATLRVVRGGSVPEAVLGEAARLGADWLVVGTHGRSGLDRLLPGSVAEACVARAPCPVLTVPAGAEAHEPSARAPVLAAVDFSDLGRAALAEARTLAALHGASLELVHVVRDAGPHGGLSRVALSLGEIDPARDAAVRRRLAGATGDDLPTHVALGPPSRQVAAVAAAVGAGVVVMGTHGRHGLAGALLGNTAWATLQRARCAILTVGAAAARARAQAPPVLSGSA